MYTTLLIALTLVATGARAEENVIDHLVEACEDEIENYCSKVTPGEGRLLACFYRADASNSRGRHTRVGPQVQRRTTPTAR